MTRTRNVVHYVCVNFFDRQTRVRIHVFIDREQRADIQRIVDQEPNATASAVIRAAITFGLPELRRALEHERRHGVPWDYSGAPGPIKAGVPLLQKHADAEGDGPEPEVEEVAQ